ncbi:hypothetical protein ACJZ2D_015460 [Fusarium nematophilum]
MPRKRGRPPKSDKRQPEKEPKNKKQPKRKKKKPQEEEEEKEEKEVWWTLREILKEKFDKRELYYLVDWDDSPSGESYPPSWVKGEDVSEDALQEWEEQKRLKQELQKKQRQELRENQLEQKRQLQQLRENQLEQDRRQQELQNLNSGASPVKPAEESDTEESQDPRPVTWKRKRCTDASTLTRPRSDSFDHDDRPSKKTRSEPEVAPSEEPVPSIISTSSADIEPSSPLSLDSDDFARLQGQRIAIELSKRDEFDTSEYHSIGNSQGSSHKVSELEEEDQRATIASHLSQNTIPDSQDLSGHRWDRAQLEGQAVTQTVDHQVVAESPDGGTDWVSQAPCKIVQPHDAGNYSQVQNPREFGSSPHIHLSRGDEHLGDLSPDSDQELPDASNLHDDQAFEEGYNTAFDQPQSLRDIEDEEDDHTNKSPAYTGNPQSHQVSQDEEELPDADSPHNSQDLPDVENAERIQHIQEVFTEVDEALDSQAPEDHLDPQADEEFQSDRSHPGDQDSHDKPITPGICSSVNETSTRHDNDPDPDVVQPLKSSLPSKATKLRDQDTSSNPTPTNSLVIPDSQGLSLLSAGSQPNIDQVQVSIQQPQITPFQSQVEAVPDSVAVDSGHPESDSRESQAAQIVSQLSDPLAEKITTNNDTESDNRLEETPSHRNKDSGSAFQFQNIPPDQEASRSEDSAEKAAPSPEQPTEYSRSLTTRPVQPIPQIAPEQPSQSSNSAAAVPAMDEPSAPEPQSSAVDELKALFDFGNASLLTQVDEATGDDQPSPSSEPPKDREPITTTSLDRTSAPPELLVSSPELQMHTQPVYSVEPWKAELLESTTSAPPPSISPASIMANPHQSAVDAMREIVNMSFGDSGGSITRPLIAQDSEEMMPPGTISPAAISRSVGPVESTHTLTLSNQGAMPSGQSITMGQIPDEQEYDASSQSSHQDGSASRHLVTLPMQASRRPYYDAILKDHKRDVQEFSMAFTVEIYQEPEDALVTKIDSLFNRLLNICDYPQDVIGTSLEELPASDLAKYCCDANAKMSFLFELMSGLGEKELGSLIVARTPELLRLIFALTEATGIECSAESIGKQSTYPSVTRITLALATEEFDPFKFDVVIGYDHAFNDSPVARQLSTGNVRKPPLVLLLVTTHSIEHIGTRILDNMSTLERKNALLSGIVNARRYLEDPERGYVEPHQVAEVFASYLNGFTDAVGWEPQAIPDDVLDVFDKSQPLSQLMETDSTQGNGLKRKHDDQDDEEDDSKRIRVLPQNLPVDSNDPPLTLPMRKLLESVRLEGEGEKPGASKIRIHLSDLGALVDEYKRQVASAKELEDEYKNTITRLEKENKDYLRTTNKVSESFRRALQDRTTFEKDKQKAEAAATSAAEAARKEIEKLQTQIGELESTNKRLTEASEVSQMENMLKDSQSQIVLLQKRLENAQRDIGFMQERYQDVDAQASKLAADNKQLMKEYDETRLKASENLLRIHEIQRDETKQELLSENQQLKTQLDHLLQQLGAANDEVQRLRNGRPQTRQASVPRSPRIPMMSPRTNRATFGGSASRGTSPAAVPGYEGAAGPPGVQFMGQQPGNGRWGSHLRD